jgi:hypothetical protein
MKEEERQVLAFAISLIIRMPLCEDREQKQYTHIMTMIESAYKMGVEHAQHENI